MKRPKPARPLPPKGTKRSTVPARSAHTTVQPHPPRAEQKPPPPKRRQPTPKPALRAPRTKAPKRQVARIVDESEASVLDLIDNLLSKGVMLNADLILALADVDLVYIRLSALLCAADRVLPEFAKATSGKPEFAKAASAKPLKA